MELIATKLHRPPVPLRLVHRPHLTDRLNEGLASHHKLTLVSAPAGFGKTTCIVEWTAGLEGWPVAWLSLDAADNDPGRFFAYLVAALQKVDAALCRELGSVLRAGQLPPGEAIGTALINGVVERVERLVLVLDDVHVIQDPFVLDVLERLITNLPHSLHLVLLTREDPPLPLARLRANNQMTEIRAANLRFARPDAECFLNDVMDLALSPGDVTRLEERTEGWIAGLQLAALAMQPSRTVHSARDRSDFIAGLSGSHRFILSYLTEEVLGRQPAEIQHFLLQTSILDKLNGALCDAVTGRRDSRDLLARLYRAGLFLIPLDDEGQWYRYHHLFADLLRDRQNTLHPTETDELHGRASRWYTAAGDEGDAYVSEAIEHALSARDHGLAVTLLERHAMDLIMRGYVSTVNRWVQAIPDELHSSSPRTNLAFAWMHLLRGAYVEASPYLDAARAAFVHAEQEPCMTPERAALESEWLVMQSLRLRMQGHVAEGEAAAARAIDLAPEGDSRILSLAWFALASMCQEMGDHPRAVEAYRAALRHARASDNLVAEWLSAAGIGVLAFEGGRLRAALELSVPAIERGERAGSLPPISAVVYGLIAEVRYQWLEIEQARRHAERALELSTLGGYNSGAVLCRVILARLAQIEGDLEAASRRVQEAVDLMPAQVAAYVEQEVTARLAHIHLDGNRPALAALALRPSGFQFEGGFSFPALPRERAFSYAMGLLYNSGLRLLLHEAQAGGRGNDLEAGIALAGDVIGRAMNGGYPLVAIEAHLLCAQMRAALAGEEMGLRAARADYVPALELGEPEGVLALFVEQGAPVAEALAALAEEGELGAVDSDYVERILAAFSQCKPHLIARLAPRAPDRAPAPASQGLIERLTDRELDVLHLMAKGLKYKEIAARLCVSLNTVRFHVKAIYGKLGANNRTQAIESARRHGIL